MTRLSDYLRHNALGLVAIFLALSGVTYAAGLAPNSVKSRHIKDGQVKAVDIDPAQVQARVDASCDEGQAISGVGQGGDVQCVTAGGGSGGGTVTQVATGTGLAGGPVTTTGTLSLAAPYRLPQSCGNGQVAKSNGAGSWACAGDNAGGAPTGAATGDLTGTYPAPTIAANAVNSAKVANESLTANDVLDESLTGHDIQDDTIGGADINESKLGMNCAPLGDLCVTAPGGVVSWNTAVAQCAALGMRLPSLGEASQLALNHDVPGFFGVSDYFWTDEVALLQNGNYYFALVREDGATSTATGVIPLDDGFSTSGPLCVENPRVQ